ncbi:MAG: CPBP family intramembrane glutamic endopeptidase [Gammaproteobacteria bacterium]|nr:CPBP family intramembrane glutamic endopeptidase [Gammaproteobacteria bacterium]
MLIALAGGALLAYPASFVLTGVPFSSLRRTLQPALRPDRQPAVCSLDDAVQCSPPSVTAARHAGWLNTLLPAYIAGLVIMAVLALGLWALDLSQVDQRQAFTPAFFGTALLKGLIAGIGAGLVEETLFRGALYSGLQQRINVTWAILLTSLLYSAVHFIEYPEPAGDVHWLTGLQLFPAAMTKLSDPLVFDHFLTLFLLGVLLCLLRLRDGHIWRAFAVHAGIIMVLKLDGYITNPVTGGSHDWLVNAGDARLGWLSTFWLLALVLVYGIDCYRRRPA